MRSLNKYEKQQFNRYIKSRSDCQIIEVDPDLYLCYIKTMVNEKYLMDYVKTPYFNTVMNFDAYFYSVASPVKYDETLENILISITKGYVIAIYNNELWNIVDAVKKEGRSITETNRELSFEGGMEGFVESVDINVNLITQHYHQPNVSIEDFSIGTVTKVKVSIVYDNMLVDKDLLNTISERLNNIDVPVIQSLTELQKYLFKGQLLIPRLLSTQRPDRSVRALTKGKVVIFLEGTPIGLIAPATFHEFISTVDDYYLLPIPAVFLMMLRYFALLLSVTLPAWYVAITSFNPEILRVQLALSISSSRSGVPYPSFVEVIIMLILMEFLVEASLRLPRTIGQTATTVGGLILGQAATEAHLVSTIMIIVVAAVAISNFLIPIISMNLTLRVMKYLLLALACFTGIAGVLLGVMASSCYLFSMYSFNTPFADPVGNFSIKKVISFFRKDIRS
jgi:hypothetical protein